MAQPIYIITTIHSDYKNSSINVKAFESKEQAEREYNNTFEREKLKSQCPDLAMKNCYSWTVTHPSNSFVSAIFSTFERDFDLDEPIYLYSTIDNDMIVINNEISPDFVAIRELALSNAQGILIFYINKGSNPKMEITENERDSFSLLVGDNKKFTTKEFVTKVKVVRDSRKVILPIIDKLNALADLITIEDLQALKHLVKVDTDLSKYVTNVVEFDDDKAIIMLEVGEDIFNVDVDILPSKRFSLSNMRKV